MLGGELGGRRDYRSASFAEVHLTDTVRQIEEDLRTEMGGESPAQQRRFDREAEARRLKAIAALKQERARRATRYASMRAWQARRAKPTDAEAAKDAPRAKASAAWKKRRANRFKSKLGLAWKKLAEKQKHLGQ